MVILLEMRCRLSINPYVLPSFPNIYQLIIIIIHFAGHLLYEDFNGLPWEYMPQSSGRRGFAA
jgi:hypothetical protein